MSGPKFSILAIHICSALYGYQSDRVQYMVERNRQVAALEGMEGHGFPAEGIPA